MKTTDIQTALYNATGRVATLNGNVIIRRDDGWLYVTLEQVRGRNYYTVTADTNGVRYGAKRKLAKSFPWPKSLAAGNIYTKQ